MTESITLVFGTVSKTVTMLPVGTAVQIEDAFAVQYKWQAEVTDPEDPSSTIPNPESKSDLVFRMVRKFISDTTRAASRSVAVVPVLEGVDAEFDAIEEGSVVTSP